MKKLFLLINVFILSYSCATAQYDMAIGARFGKLNNGITFKYIFKADQDIGMEVQAYSSLIAATYGYTIKGFLFDQPPFKISFLQLQLDFIAGGGFQVGYFPLPSPGQGYGYYKTVDGTPDYYGKSVVTVGVAANIGIEYRIKKKNLPFTIGIDMVPAYDFVNPGPEWFDFGLDVRYIIR